MAQILPRACRLLAMLFMAAVTRPAWAQAPSLRPAPPAQRARAVLVLSSFGDDATFLSDALTGALQNWPVGPVEVYQEFTGLDRFSGPSYETALTRLYETKYANRKLDLIIAVAPPALAFLVANRLMPEVPVVTCFVPLRLLEEARQRRPELTGSIHPQSAPPTLDLMLKMFPRTRHVHVVLGASEYERQQAQFGRIIFSRFAGRVDFDYMNDLTLEQMMARLSGLGEADLVLFGSISTDASSHGYKPSPDPITRLAEASARPMFGGESQTLGRGVFGGLMFGSEETAQASAEMAFKVLGGQAASKVPVNQNPAAVPMFDWRQMRRFGLKEADLPPGSVIRFREPSLWRTYWKGISSAIAIILVEGLLVATLVLELRRRKRVERSLAEAEMRYRTVADFTHDWEYWQRADGSFIYLSPSCKRVSGHGPGEFLQDPDLFNRLVLEEDRPAWAAHQALVLHGTAPEPIEYRVRTGAGETRWVEQTNNPVTLEGMPKSGTRGSLRDITARKQAELALKRAYGEIEALKDRLELENTYYREQAQEAKSPNDLLGQSDAMRVLQFKISQVAPSETTVLIQGETGTGKELVAEAIHSMGPRAGRPLVKVNCAALPQMLAESELFGHEKGAFTGAEAQRKGRFELADGATLFLDEIGELPMEIQAKLLRVLQDGEFQRVGGTRTLKVNVRILAATNRDLSREVATGQFREDLWYRLNVFPITLPPLRNRKEDLPALTMALVVRFCQKLGRPGLDVPKAVLRTLESYHWPGNVRELQNVIERAVLVSRGQVLQLAESLQAEGAAAPATTEGFQTLEAMERGYLLRVLQTTRWKVSGPQGAAAIVGLNESTLRSRMAKLDISRTTSG